MPRQFLRGSRSRIHKSPNETTASKWDTRLKTQMSHQKTFRYFCTTKIPIQERYWLFLSPSTQKYGVFDFNLDWKIKIKLMKNYSFELGDLSMLSALWRNRTFKIPTKRINQSFLNPIDHQNAMLYIEASRKPSQRLSRTTSCNRGKCQIESNSLAISNYQISHTRNKIIDFWIQIFLKDRILPIEKFKKNLVVVGHYGDTWAWLSRFSKINIFPSNSDQKDFEASNGIEFFHFTNPPNK